jgi:dsRNA-specific ribonuclease
VQNYFGSTKPILKVKCRKTDATQHAQRWKCSFLLKDVPMGEGESDAPNQRTAKKEAAQKALQWMEEKGYP